MLFMSPCHRKLRVVSSTALLWLALAGCESPRNAVPPLKKIYRNASRVEVRNPVVVIHGILGSRLEQRSTGTVVWGAFTGKSADPATVQGARAFAVPMEVPGSHPELEERDVHAVKPLEKIDIGTIFGLVSVDVYAGILRTLGVGGYRDSVIDDKGLYREDHYTCFSFFYDWRQDCAENAQRLGRYLREKRLFVVKETKRRIAELRKKQDPVAKAEARQLESWLARGFRFDLVAHSMGGLIARYYLRYGERSLDEVFDPQGRPKIDWSGAREVDRLILVATPNFGSIDALEQLLEGYQASIFLPYFNPVIVGTLPSLYQLLPRRRHRVLRNADGTHEEVNFLAPEFWIDQRIGLFSKKYESSLERLLPGLSRQERQVKAEKFLRYCLRAARRFQQALDAKPSKPCPSEIHGFAADAIPTLAAAGLEKTAKGYRFDFSHSPSRMSPGDGVVARYSALGDERQGKQFLPYLHSPIPWTHVSFLPDDHVGLTSNPWFSNNLLFLLLEQKPALKEDRK